MSEETEPGADERSEEIQVAREEVVEALATAAEMYGVRRSCGRLYGVLYFADEPLSLDELAERSGYAKSTVSTVMSTLERYNFAYRRSRPGEGKRAFFEAERDWWRAVEQILRREGQREIATMTRALDAAEAKLEASDDERAAADLERVRRLQEFYDQAELLVDLVSGQSIEDLLWLFETAREDSSDASSR